MVYRSFVQVCMPLPPPPLTPLSSPTPPSISQHTQGLDPASRRVLWEVIKASKPGRAIILTTHNMEEAEFLCDRYAHAPGFGQGGATCMCAVRLDHRETWVRPNLALASER